MARWASRSGPPANFPIPVTPTTIPGMVISDNYDPGPLLVLVHVRVINPPPGGGVTTLAVTLDGVDQPGSGGARLMPANSEETITPVSLIPITPGPHTLELLISGPGTANHDVLANRTLFAVIQLPLWDRLAKLL